MPQAIAAGIISAVGATGAVATAITIATYAVSIVASLALSSAQKRKAERAQRAQYDASVVDRLVNTKTTTGPWELVLGRVRKGGTVFFESAVAPHNAVFLTCIALAHHEIDAVERVYFGDTPIDLDASGNVTTAPWGRINKITERDTSYDPVRTLVNTPIPGTLAVLAGVPFGSADWYYPNAANSVPYTIVGNTLTITDPDPGTAYTVSYQWEQFVSTARVFWHLGSPGQAADARLQLYLPNTWTPDHRASGVAYLECEFVYEEASFPSGLPPITAQIRGAKVYDPRSGITQWSDNPALLDRHVLLHPQFGKRTSLTASEDARIGAAANACDLPFQYWPTAPVVPMFRAAGVYQYGTSARDVLDDITQAMAGEWAYAAGEFFVRAGAYQAPVMALADDDLAVVQRSNDGSVSQVPITISPHKPRNDKVNVVNARIWDESANFVLTPITPFKADALILDDGMELPIEVTMPAVFYAAQAFHIAGIMLRDSRDPLTVTLPFKMSAYPLELFDSVTLTLARYGWTSKEFRIVDRTFQPGGYVELTLKETTAAIFTYGTPFSPQGYAENTGLPKPWEIDPPTIVSIFSGEAELVVQTDGTVLNGVRVTWQPVVSESVQQGGTIEVQYLALPDGDWRSVVVPGDATQAVILGAPDLAVLVIRVRSRNSLGASAWSAQQFHQVIGKTEPPPNIENLTIAGSVLSWGLPRRVPDLAGFVFRFHYGNNLDWNSAVALHTGVLTESPYDLVTRPGGVVTIMGKAIDTSGNMSPATANIVMNLGDPPIANVVEQWDFDALGWPYDVAESSGWTIVSGDPSANALDSFYGTDDQSFYAQDTDPFYETGTYGQMIYVTQQVAVGAALSGSVMSLVAEVQGADLKIEYRLAGPGSFFGPDSASFYRDDADSLYGPPGDWLPWPGQIIAANDVYQFRVTIGAGTTRGILQALMLTVDAPDIVERINDLVVAAGGTTIPYTRPFTVIKNISGTLQANGSGGVTLETTKTPNLAPVVRVFNSAHTSVSGASVDLTLYGY